MRCAVALVGGWCLAMAMPAVSAQPAGDSAKASNTVLAEDTIAISVRGITDGSTEDNPGVLYILPWQPPTLPRRTREALESSAPELLQPMDPTVFRRHREFQHSMSPRVDSSDITR